MNELAVALTAFVERLPEPASQDREAIAEVQITVDRMALALSGGRHLAAKPEVQIYVRPDRTYYWTINRANGVTFAPDCLHRTAEVVDGERSTVACGEDATEMVGPESLCAAHAVVRREANACHDAAMKAYMESPEGIAEARREQEWEARVS